MKTGIIVAMGKELDLLLPLMNDRASVTINDFKFHTGKIGNREVIAMQSGIGKVNAAIATLTLIENFHPSLVINTGVAGGTGKGAGILDVVIGRRIAITIAGADPEQSGVRLPAAPGSSSRFRRSPRSDF